MKPVDVLPSDASVLDAARTMKDAEVNLVPVGSSPEQIDGVVTPRDITVFAVADACRAATMPVGEIATPVMAFCQEDQDIREVIDGMRAYHQTRLLVRDAEGHVVGVVSLDDIVAACPIAELAS